MICIKKHIPNALTCCNLICGGIATNLAFSGQTEEAMLFIIIGAVFDFFDGFVARLLKVSSPIGKELDSLADDITFGLAPAAMVFYLLGNLTSGMACPVAKWIPYTAFLIAAFSGLRLAKFNLDTRQTTSFIGLPTPANALFWGAFVLGAGQWLSSWHYSICLVFALVLLSSYLLIAEIPMFALKFKNFSWGDNKVRYLFLLVSIALLLLLGITGLSIVILWYVFLSSLTRKREN
ncbi:MAG: CDP-diacylglycerol--serine O-phosphatidyltransferase [Bacteroidaceae bacterium]